MILAAGTLAQSSFSAASIGLPALGPALRSDYGLSLSDVGVVLAGIQIGMLFTLLPWGLLADRFDERWVVAVGLAAAAGALVASAHTRTFAAVTGTLVLGGAFGASVNAATGRAIMGWFDRSELGLALGIRQTGIPIGGAVGAAVLPTLASSGGTRLAFLFLAGACGVGALASAVFLRGAPPREPELHDLSSPLREPQLWVLSVGTGLLLTAQIGITGFLVLFLHGHRHMAVHTAAAVLAGLNVLAIGARIGSGRLSDRLRSRLRPLRAIAWVLTAATALVAALTDGPLWVLVAAMVVAGVLSMSWNGLAFAATAEAAGAGRSGVALGFQQTVLGVATAGVPPAIAAIASSSWRAAFVVAAAGPLCGSLLLSRSREQTPGTSAIPPAAP